MNFKRLAALAAAGILAVSFTACSKEGNAASSVSSSSSSSSAQGTSEATELLDKAKKANEALENYEGSVDLQFAFKNDSGESTADVQTAITDFQSSPITKKIEITSQGNGQDLGTSQFYLKEEDGQKILFLNYEADWYKTKIDDEMLFYTLGQYDLKSITKIFLDAVSDVKTEGEEDVDGKKTVKLTGTIGEDKIKSTLIDTGVFVVSGMSSLTEEQMDGTPAMPITFYVDSKTGDVLKIEFDASPAYQIISDNVYKLVKDDEQYKDMQQLMINKYAFVYQLKNCNNAAQIEFPSELDNAIDMEEMAAEQTTKQEEGAAANAAQSSADSSKSN